MRSISQLMDLRDRVALVSGGGGYIGEAVAEAFAELGAKVVLVDIDREKTCLVADRLRGQYGVQTEALVRDLSDTDAIAEIGDLVSERFGGLHVLVNCAALVGTSRLTGWSCAFEKQERSTWDRAVALNLSSVFSLVQSCLEPLRDSGKGAIINVASIYGISAPDPGLYEGIDIQVPAAYAASKGGLLQFTRYLAAVLAPEVRVNAISPGGIEREGQNPLFQKRYCRRTPLQRMGREEDIKGAAVFLASDLSAYVTGHNLVVDGGWSV